MIKKLFLDLFTERDGLTWDYTKITGTVGIGWWSGLMTYDVFQGTHPDPEKLAWSLSGLILAIGGGIAMRNYSKDTVSDNSKSSN